MLNKITVNPRNQKLVVCIFLLVVTFAVFWQVNKFDFINLDDDVYVTNNIHVQSGITLDGIRWAFSTTYAQFWHPLTWLSLMLDDQLYGTNTGGDHLTNLILHILSTMLLFWLFNRMTGAIWPSAFVAAFFALHPLHVESVAWIAKRKDVLSAFFWMVTLCFYVYYTEKPVIKRYLLVLFSFVLALMSKPMVITLPVVMIFLDYWPLKRFDLSKGNPILWQLKEKMPFFILSAVFSVITFFVHQKPLLKHFPLSSRMANAPVSFVTYIEKTLWPQNLAVYYPFSNQIPLWQVAGAVFLIIVISLAVIAKMKRLPYLFVGWLWYTITILPVIGIIQVNAQAMSDHYTYLPTIGIAIMLAWGIPLFFQREEMRKKNLFPAGIAVLAVWAFLAWHQCGYWKDGITLYDHALQLTKDNYLIHNNRGNIYGEEGQYQRAIEDFNEAIRIRPDYDNAYNNRGLTYTKLGEYQLATKDFKEAIRLNSDNVDAYFNRGFIYAKLGLYRQSLEDFSKMITLRPDYTNAYYNRGLNYVKLGQYQPAIEDFNKAISLKKNDVDIYAYRGEIYLRRGDINLGCLDARKACDLGNCELLKSAKDKGYCH